MEVVGSTLSQRILSSFNFDLFEAYSMLQRNYFFCLKTLDDVAAWAKREHKHNSKHIKVEKIVNISMIFE